MKTSSSIYKNHLVAIALSAFLLGALSTNAYARSENLSSDTTEPQKQSSTEKKTTRSAISVADDNDFFGKWSDKYYTNHTRLAFTLGADEEGDFRHSYFFSFGQEMYTPEDRLTEYPTPRDHPYAGYLYGSAGITIFDDDFAISQEIQVGVTGDWAHTENTQKNYHSIIEEVEPMGWDTQIHERVVVQAIGEVRRRFVLDGACGNRGYGADMIFQGVGSVGNLRGVLSAGTQIRAGWNLPKDFGSSRLRQGTSVTYDPQVNASFYGYLGLQGDAILWDKTLTGNNGYGSNINAYPFVGEISLGVCLIYDRYMLSIFQAIRTKDFSSQDSDFFVYGGFKLSVFF